MGVLNEKVAYIKGLMDGLKVSDNTPEGKVLTAVVELLSDITDAVEFLEEDYEEVRSQVEGIDEDLAALETDFYEEADDCMEEDMYEITCPNCNEVIFLDVEDFAEEEVVCPNCNEAIELDIHCDCGCEDECDDDCDCGHDHHQH